MLLRMFSLVKNGAKGFRVSGMLWFKKLKNSYFTNEIGYRLAQQPVLIFVKVNTIDLTGGSDPAGIEKVYVMFFGNGFQFIG